MGLKLTKGNASDGGYIIEGDIHVSYRSLEALYLSALGLDNKEAAENMGIGVNTYRNHVYGVVQKLGAGNRANALLKAIENGMFEVNENYSLLGNAAKEWILCWKCNRAFLAEDAQVVQQEPFVIDHVLVHPPLEKICAYEGCGAKLWDGWEWDEVREIKPEFPKIPVKGKVYKVDWLNKKAQEFIEMKRKEIDVNRKSS